MAQALVDELRRRKIVLPALGCRHATLVAIALATGATLTDQILDLHDRLIGSFFSRDKNQHAQRFAADGKALNAKVRLYAQGGQALIASREAKDDPFDAIEQILPWKDFQRSVEEAERLARDEEFDALALIVEHHGQLRRRALEFLTTFDFRPAPVRKPLIDALNVLREMNRRGDRDVPGDVWVVGSRQFKDFDEYLLAKQVFAQRKADGLITLPVPHDAKAYLGERLALLHKMLDEVNALAAAGELPDVQLDDKGLKISPIEDDTPPEAKDLVAQIAAMLPPVKITHLLQEVIGWIDFTQQFTHLKTGEPSKDRKLLLTALLADAFKLGLDKMAQACPGISAARLMHHVAWHVRTDTYSWPGSVASRDDNHRLAPAHTGHVGARRPAP